VDHFQAWHQVNAATLWAATVAAVAVLAGVAAFLWARLRRLQVRYARLMDDSEGGSLQETLEDHVRRVRGALDRVDALERLTRDLERTLGHSVQGVGMVRFNPFRDTGGDQSFAVALADAHGDGLVLSSLHHPDNTRVYAKPLLAWQSTHPLTEEEREAIEAARRSCTPR
jgi:HAMP domain-containing protein